MTVIFKNTSTTKFEEMRRKVFQEFKELYTLHSSCAQVITDLRESYVDSGTEEEWTWKLRAEWHIRMATSIKNHLLNRYAAEKNELEALFNKMENNFSVELMAELSMKKTISMYIERIRSVMKHLKRSISLPRQVDDMVEDHEYVLRTLYAA